MIWYCSLEDSFLFPQTQTVSCLQLIKMKYLLKKKKYLSTSKTEFLMLFSVSMYVHLSIKTLSNFSGTEGIRKTCRTCSHGLFLQGLPKSHSPTEQETIRDGQGRQGTPCSLSGLDLLWFTPISEQQRTRPTVKPPQNSSVSWWRPLWLKSPLIHCMAWLNREEIIHPQGLSCLRGQSPMHSLAYRPYKAWFWGPHSHWFTGISSAIGSWCHGLFSEGHSPTKLL